MLFVIPPLTRLRRAALSVALALAVLGTLVGLAPTAATAAAGPAIPAGIAVAIGGALSDDNTAVWGRLVQLAGGPGARFVVLATASAEPQRSAAQIVANLQRHGALAEALPVAPGWPGVDVQRAVQDPRWLELIAGSQGVFFSGGAQARLLDALQPGGGITPLLAAIHALFNRGGVVAGTSSGAAVLSEVIFRDAPDVLAVLKGRLRDGIEVDRGFAFVMPGVAVDQHFIKRGRIGRLLPLYRRSICRKSRFWLAWRWTLIRRFKCVSSPMGSLPATSTLSSTGPTFMWTAWISLPSTLGVCSLPGATN